MSPALLPAIGLKITIALATALLTSHASAVLVFSHDFQDGTNGEVTSAGTLGTPAAGNFSFSGSPVGSIRSNPAGTVRALAVGHSSNNVANMADMQSNTATYSGSFPETQVADAGGGDRVFANFSEAGSFTGAGESTSISFRTASFGNSNTGAFKYTFVRGLDSSDAEVFELLIVAGSGSATREAFARGPSDDSTTLTAASSGTPQGTKLVDAAAFGLNSTGNPPSMWNIGITLENGMVTYDINAAGGVTSTASNGTALPINSAATDLAKIEFSSVWNASVDAQNKGYWVDDLVVNATPVMAAIPEPSSLLAFGLISTVLGSSVGWRRRG